jgi:endonuclease/exonuclease/phosphatase family metal-dependent hydrolase
MRHTLVFCVLLASCNAAHPATAPNVASDARVLVYNIHAGKDAAGIDNLTRVAELVRSTKADIVLLQEVDKGTRRSGNVDQPAVLASTISFSPQQFTVLGGSDQHARIRTPPRAH